MSIGVGIYGSNGHQVHNALVDNALAHLASAAEFPEDQLPASLKGAVPIRSSLDDLLADPGVQLVALCSPIRAQQAAHAIRALRAGKHVYAEKPCAMSEDDIDAILRTAAETGCRFHEMAGTAFGQPYLAMRRIVAEGRIGEVVQVLVEKSYPYHEARPQDEAIDGGLIGQNAIHGVRMVEHVAGVCIESIAALETTKGNPVHGGGLRMASSLLCRLENGGVASISANYLNPRGTGVWGDESLRILGDRGIVESTNGGARTRLVIGAENGVPIPQDEPSIDYFDYYLKSLGGQREKMPLTAEQELSATRWVLRAKAIATRSANGY